MGPKKNSIRSSPIAPAASGGPGTFRGCSYQIGCAVLQSLDLISRFLYEPLAPFSITIEPRLVQAEGVSRWDIQISSPLTMSEAKVNLSKQDLIGFLDRASEVTGADSTLELIYGGCRTSLLNSVKRLCTIAVESGQDGAKFYELASREEIAEAQAVLGALGSDAMGRLRRLAFRDLPESLLNGQLEFRARLLSPDDPRRLIDFLSKRFLEAAVSRQRYEVPELVSLIEEAGITLVRPNEVRLTNLSPRAIDALALLQALPLGLPGMVVASTSGATVEQLQDELCSSDLLSIDGEIWQIRPLRYQVPFGNREHLMSRGFEELLGFLAKNETYGNAEGQVRNAIQLARRCLPIRPSLALLFFKATEHVVKNLGDKHLLLEISNLCIDAGNYKNVNEIERGALAQARAQAWLCGTSWVFQRMNRLEEARLWAEKSLRLGKDIGWDRNTAFAMKCIGRLDRVEAERPGTGAERRTALLEASSEKLRAAIEMFSKSDEFGPTHRQIGDCYSLLARTYVTARKHGAAEAAMRMAYEILPPDTSKEYFDLTILTGDFEIVWGTRDHAEVRFTEVIERHTRESREHSEIHARALSKRAANRAKLRRKETALSDYRRAVEVWRSLAEHEEAAEMEWARIELEGKVDPGTLRLFNIESSSLARLLAFQKYLKQLEGSRAVAHRSRPTGTQVEQYLKDARQNVAVEYPEW